MSAPLIEVPLDHLPRARWRGRASLRVLPEGSRRPAPVGAIAAAGTAAVLVLFGATVLISDVRSGEIALPAFPSFAAAVQRVETPSRPLPPSAALARFAGRWVMAGGTGFVIARSGAVWIDAGHRLGEVRHDGGDAVALQGDGFKCAYAVTFDTPDSSTWRLTDAMPKGWCPDGKLTRPFTY